MKDGGGIPDFTYSIDDEITVDFLREKASKPFFPEGDSKLGALPPMKLELGNYTQQEHRGGIMHLSRVPPITGPVFQPLLYVPDIHIYRRRGWNISKCLTEKRGL